MQLMNEIPDTFWSLFRSVNRDIYIEALLCINEEYEYNNYFLTKEVCIQILSDMNAKKRFELQREENDTDFDMLAFFEDLKLAAAGRMAEAYRGL